MCFTGSNTFSFSYQYMNISVYLDVTATDGTRRYLNRLNQVISDYIRQRVFCVLYAFCFDDTNNRM